VTGNLGMLFAPALGIYVLSAWGYTVHFLAAAGIAACSVALLLPVTEPQRESSGETEAPALREVARVRPVWAATLGSTGLAVAYGAVLSFLPPFAAEQSLAAVGAYFAAFAVAMMIVQAPAGWLSDRIGRRAVAAPGMGLAALAMVGLATARTDTALLAAGAGLGVSWGLVRAALDSAVVDSVPPAARGTALAFFYTGFDLGVGAGSFGLGVVAQAQGYAAAFYLAAAWAVATLAGYLGWGRVRA
jgi:predicted MFS family arabinose efflux permease